MDLACRILDEAPFRDNMTQKMAVQPAKFQQKGEEFVAKKKPKKKKAAAVVQKQEKVLGWGGFDDKLPAYKVGAPGTNRNEACHCPTSKPAHDDVVLDCAHGGCMQSCDRFHHQPVT